MVYIRRPVLVAGVAIVLTGIGAGLAGCGQAGRIEAAWTGHSVHCIDGVSYIQFASGATVQYDKATKQIKLCDG